MPLVVDELCILVAANWSHCGIFLLTWSAWWLLRCCLGMKWDLCFCCLCLSLWRVHARGWFSMCLCHFGLVIVIFCALPCDPQRGLVEAQRSAMLPGYKNVQVSQSEVAALPAWHYKCAILRGKCPQSPRCDHTSLLGGLCWLTGVSAKYGTDMISWQRPPSQPTFPPLYLCLFSAGISLCHSSPSLCS